MEFEGIEELVIVHGLRRHNKNNAFIPDIITSNIPVRLHLSIGVDNNQPLIKYLSGYLGAILVLTSINGNDREVTKDFEELPLFMVAKHGRYFIAIFNATTGRILLNLRPFPGTTGCDVSSLEYNVITLIHDFTFLTLCLDSPAPRLAVTWPNIL